MINSGKNISRRRLNESISTLSEFGVKYAGTTGESKARDYILDKLREIGLESVRLEGFEYLNYMPKQGVLELTLPTKETVNCEPLQYSANGEVEGELVYAGNSKKEFEELANQGVSFDGKIVLTESPFPFLVYPLAEELGASGVIIATDPPDGLIRVGLGVSDRRKGTIPGITVSKGTGDNLKKKLRSGKAKVRIDSLGVYSKKKSWNVIGKIRGKKLPEEKIACCSHYDSQIKGPHAWDNVSGDAGLLEIARVMSDSKPERTVEILFFGVEELGFWGSTSFVKRHRKEISNYRVLVNLDGFSSSLCPKNFLETTPEVREFALKVAKGMKWPVHHADDPMPLSDHVPFLQANVPVIWIHEGLIDPYYHTEGDIPEHIDPEKLEEITRVTTRCLSDLAFSNELSF